jgi:hypothetical protein
VRGRLTGTFSYGHACLARPGAYAIDPIEVSRQDGQSRDYAEPADVIPVVKESAG